MNYHFRKKPEEKKLYSDNHRTHGKQYQRTEPHGTGDNPFHAEISQHTASDHNQKGTEKPEKMQGTLKYLRRKSRVSMSSVPRKIY
jgi:hypothetical protein